MSLKNLFERICPELATITRRFKDVTSMSNSMSTSSSVNDGSNSASGNSKNKSRNNSLNKPYVCGQISKVSEHPAWIGKLLIDPDAIRIGTFSKEREEKKIMDPKTNTCRFVTVVKDLSFVSCLSSFTCPRLIFAEEKVQREYYETFMAMLDVKFSANYQIDKDKNHKNIAKVRTANSALFDKVSKGLIDRDLIQMIVNIVEVNVLIIDLTRSSKEAKDSFKSLTKNDLEIYYPHSRLHPHLNLKRNLVALVRTVSGVGSLSASAGIDSANQIYHYDLIVPSCVLENRVNLINVFYYLNNVNSQMNIPDNPEAKIVENYNKYPLAPELAYYLNKKDDDKYQKSFAVVSSKSQVATNLHVYQLNNVLDYWLQMYLRILQVPHLRHSIVMFQWDVKYLIRLVKEKKLSFVDFAEIHLLHFMDYDSRVRY